MFYLVFLNGPHHVAHMVAWAHLGIRSCLFRVTHFAGMDLSHGHHTHERHATSPALLVFNRDMELIPLFEIDVIPMTMMMMTFFSLPDCSRVSSQSRRMETSTCKHFAKINFFPSWLGWELVPVRLVPVTIGGGFSLSRGIIVRTVYSVNNAEHFSPQ